MNEPDKPWHIPDAQLHPSMLVRMVLLALGSIALLLGIIGIFLPGLPTTPFILVAAALLCARVGALLPLAAAQSDLRPADQ